LTFLDGKRGYSPNRWAPRVEMGGSTPPPAPAVLFRGGGGELLIQYQS